VFYIPSNTV